MVLGPNDSGKSTILRAIERDLSGGHFADVAPEDYGDTGGVFFAELSRAELGALISEAAEHRVQNRRRYGARWQGDRPPWDDRIWSLRREAADAISNLSASQDPVAATIEVALLQTTDAEAGATIAAALGRARIVALECAGRDQDHRRVWNAYWCLRPAATLDDDLEDALERVGLREKTGSDTSTPRTPIRRGLYEVLHGRPTHLLHDAAPVPVVSLGPVTVSMPTCIAAPTRGDRLREAVEHALTDVVNAARYGIEDAGADGAPLETGERNQRRPPRAWVDTSEESGVRVRSEVVGGARLISEAATRRLPSFIARNYEVRVEITSIADWLDRFDGRPLLEVRLRAAAAGGAGLFEEFGLERAAEGYLLWIQLALLQALEDALGLADSLRQLARDAIDAAREAQEAEAIESANAPDFAAAADDLSEHFDRLVSILCSAAGEDSTSGKNALEKLNSCGAWGARSSRELPWFVVVDEPERHLHGRLLRAAAEWLTSTATTVTTPCLISTHSAAFLSLPSASVLYVGVRRTDIAASFDAFTPAQLGELDIVADAMGFDRGELLSTVRCWLVVEGLADQIVLERLIGTELRRAGIVVLPLHGTARWKGILEADALWRYVRVPVAVMFDNVPPERVNSLKAMTNEELAALTKSSTEASEVKDMAQLVRTIREHGRVIEPVPSRHHDILGYLDEGVLRDHYPKFPGHAEAERQWMRHRKGSRDQFYRERYEIQKTPEALAEVAAAMVDRGLHPPELVEVARYCGQLGAA